MENKEKIGINGMHIITLCDMRSRAALLLEEAIEHNIQRRWQAIKAGLGTPATLHRLWEDYHRLLTTLHDKFLLDQVIVKNLTTTVGRSVLMQRLAGTTTYTGVVNYGALGSNSTAPTVGDTTLNTEVYRKALSSGTYVSNVAYLENFYTAAEITGTFQEYGFFIDGNAGANTGQLFNRFISAVTKSSTQSLNVQSIITLASA